MGAEPRRAPASVRADLQALSKRHNTTPCVNKTTQGDSKVWECPPAVRGAARREDGAFPSRLPPTCAVAAPGAAASSPGGVPFRWGDGRETRDHSQHETSSSPRVARIPPRRRGCVEDGRPPGTGGRAEGRASAESQRRGPGEVDSPGAAGGGRRRRGRPEGALCAGFDCITEATALSLYRVR